MFAKKHTSMFGAFAIDSKASRGRHARVKGRAQFARCAFESSAGQAQAFSGQRASRSACRAIEGPAGQVQTFAGQRIAQPLSFDEGEFLIDGYGAYAPYDQTTERYAVEDSLLDEESSETVENVSSCDGASSAQLERIAEGARSDGGPQIELEVLAEHAPANVANCFAAILREALSNTMRHARAQNVTVRCMEHPSFYQLIVTDDGTGATKTNSRGIAEGMGLGSMRERVEALGGTFTAGPRAGAPGWRVFATVPKQQGDDAR